MILARTIANSGLCTSLNTRRVLVVEDDVTSREFLRLALEKSGDVVVTADCVTSAQENLLSDGFEKFDCVVTDYRMPGQSGLDLLAWLKKEAPALATIILTAEGEKSLVTRSLRGGAADFLEKPVNIAELRRTVSKAADLTRRQRHTAQVETAVKDLGRAQQRMINASGGPAPVDVEICFHPKLEAGGDSFSHYHSASDQYFCLLTDVSGHDLEAAYISAYFQGVVRGMLDCSKPVPEILRSFNRFLIEEWNQTEKSGSEGGSSIASVAACSILLDLKAQTASVLTSGVPAPVFVAPDGRARAIGHSGGYPLGWFPDYDEEPAIQTTPPDSAIFLWTDGLADLAEQLEVSPLSIGCRLQHAKATGEKVPALDRAGDDILFAGLHLSAKQRHSMQFAPLLLEEYDGAQLTQIDQLEAFWLRCVRMALPDLSNRAEYDLLLAAREAVLNGLKHGCGGQAGKTVMFQVSYQPDTKTIRVWVEDSGPGHQFDFVAHEKKNVDCLLEEHRGLMLINNLASAVAFERNRASLIMDFVF